MREQNARILHGVVRDNPPITFRALRRAFIGKSHKERASLKRLANGSLLAAVHRDPVLQVSDLRSMQARVRQVTRLPSVLRGKR